MLKHLSLTNYRNHQKFDLELDDINVLVGKNGVGKTNVLEAIGVVGYGRSFKGENRSDLVSFNADYARIVADELEIFIQSKPRLLFQAKERGVKRKLSDFIGSLLVVVFSPESLGIVSGEPKERRRFLDILISQKNHKYFQALVDYKKVLTQRNNLLKRIADGQAGESELDFWDGELVRLATDITRERLIVVNDFSEQLSPFYRLISGDDKSELVVLYHPKADENYAEKLTTRRPIDIAAGMTLSGPHRDDLIFKLNSLEAQKFASRGELRSVVLAIKMAELKYLEDGKKPILLLDDIFSEFDADRRSHLYELIKNYQTLITTTDREHLSEKMLKNAKITELEAS